MDLDTTESASNIPQDVARRLFEDGAILIISGIPLATEFGVDLTAYKVGGKFRGIKMIPPGPHFVYTSAQGPYGDTAHRVGFIHYFKKQEIVIREWDDDKEELRVRTKVDSEVEIARIRDHLQELDEYLGPYDYEGLKKWKTLTDDITEEIILAAAPLQGTIRTSAEFQSCPDADRPKGSSPLTTTTKIRPGHTEDDLLPNLQVVPGTAPRFTKIPPLCPLTATPAEVSLAHLDSINAIEAILRTVPNPIDIIPEIQFAFVLYLSGCSIDALAHWRKLLGLLSKSETAVERYRSFYRRYLDILHYQLPELPVELMTPSANNTVYNDVRQLIINCSVGGLKPEADHLSLFLSSEMLWTFENLFEEDPEDMPVVVEMSNT